MLLLIWAAAFGFCLAIRFAFRALDGFGHGGPSIRLLAALAVEFRAVGISEFDEVIIIDLSNAPIIAAVAATHAVGLYGMIALGPIADVEIMDVLLDDVVAAYPDEVIPVAHLVFHFGLAGFAWPDPDRTAVPISP